MKKIFYHIILALLLSGGLSCSYSKKFTNSYYQQNEAMLLSIRQRFEAMYDKQPFSLELKDKTFQRIGLEIITDSIRYIYNFRLDEPYLLDTLYKYKFDAKEVGELIDDMQKAHCTWITHLDYYEKREKKELLFISVRHKKLEAFLQPEKYFTLAFFNQAQPFDEKKRLLDNEDYTELRKINGEVFRSITDSVFYALTRKFR